MVMRRIAPILLVLPGLALCACDDLSGFTTSETEVYSGEVLDADIVRKGFESGTSMEMTFDIALVNGDEEHIGPGTITTIPPGHAEPLFVDADLFPIASIVHDQLSGFDFPTGRLKNYLFLASPSGPYTGHFAVVVVSLLSDGDVEVRIILGPEDLYGIFTLEKVQREEG